MEQAGELAIRAAGPLVPAPERLTTLDGLASGWLLRFGANTRDAYGPDLRSWVAWCDQVGVDPLRAGLHHADAYSRWLIEVATTRDGGRLAPSSVNRRLSALASFYRYCVRQRVLTESPFFEVARPAVSGDSTTTGMSRDELRRLVEVAQAASVRSLVRSSRSSPSMGCASPKRRARHAATTGPATAWIGTRPTPSPRTSLALLRSALLLGVFEIAADDAISLERPSASFS